VSAKDSQNPLLTADKLSVQALRVLEGVVGIPATENNRITVLRNGCEIFPAMLDAVRAAEHTIDFLKCDEEIKMVIFDPAVVKTQNSHFDDDLERSVQIDPRRWKRRSLTQRLKERVVAPLRGVYRK